MMKINWNSRFKSKTFLVSLFSLILLLSQQFTSMFGLDITIHSEQVTNIFNTILSVLVLLGVVHDPTTSGLSDSQRVLQKGGKE